MERVSRESPSTRASSFNIFGNQKASPEKGEAFHISGPKSQETPDASVAMCLSPFLRGHREFRTARSRAPLPDSVLAGGGMTEGVWQGGSVMSTLRREPCRASRHDRGWWKTPRDIIGMARGSVEVALPRPYPPGVSRFWRIRCHPDRPPASHSSPRHSPPPGVSRFRRFCCYLGRQPAPRGPLRHPPPPGVSRFTENGSHLRRVAQAPG